jgi:hypothetical protein
MGVKLHEPHRKAVSIWIVLTAVRHALLHKSLSPRLKGQTAIRKTCADILKGRIRWTHVCRSGLTSIRRRRRIKICSASAALDVCIASIVPDSRKVGFSVRGPRSWSSEVRFAIRAALGSAAAKTAMKTAMGM